MWASAPLAQGGWRRREARPARGVSIQIVKGMSLIAKRTKLERIFEKFKFWRIEGGSAE